MTEFQVFFFCLVAENRMTIVNMNNKREQESTAGIGVENEY